MVLHRGCPMLGSVSFGVRLLVALLFLEQSVSCFTQPRKNITHHWKTGDWESCLSSPSCGEGQRKRSVWCADSEGFKTFELNCESQKKPAVKEGCFKVCDSLELQLWWDVGDWGACVSQAESNRSISTGRHQSCKEGSGVSVRDVSCKYQPLDTRSVKLVPDSACAHFWEKPKSESGCSYDCPIDCSVSEFGKLTDCFQCSGNRTRSRWVVTGPTQEGKSCPHLTESTLCDSEFLCPEKQSSELGSVTVAKDDNALLKIGAWGKCLPPVELESNETLRYSYRSGLRQGTTIGKQTRQVMCLNAVGEIIAMDQCMKSQHWSWPARSRSCLIPIDCGLSPWSEWRVVQEGCSNSLGENRPEIRTRSRKVLRLPQGNGRPCALSFEKRIIKDNLQLCDKYKWVSLPWSQCNITSLGNQSESKCGLGKQSRHIICVQAKDLMPVPNSLCFEPMPQQYQECSVVCPRDCVVSPWSSWSSCIPLEIKNYLDPPSSGYMKRTRHILTHPISGDCPALQESDPCEDLEVYTWKYGNWNECVALDNISQCGIGLRSRSYQCVILENTPVSDAYCDLHSVLEDEEECDIHCPGDCVPSEWSEWSACSAPCFDSNMQGKRERRRNILAHASSDGVECPDMREKEECNFWSCVGFSWKAGEWDPCQVKGDDPYGEGVQTRRLWCVKNDTPVKEKHCHPLPRLLKQRKCEIPRPVDCKVTAFSRWTTCPDYCVPASTQHRDRFILEQPLHGGKICPEILNEIRPCFETNDPICYQRNLTYDWYFGNWSDCTVLEVNEKCGVGIQTRHALCRSNVGLDVEAFLCLQNSSGNSPVLLTRVCNVDCSSKCITTEWVSESSCKDDCKQQVVRRDVIANHLNGSHCHNQVLNKAIACPPTEVLPDDPNPGWQSCVVEEPNDCGNGSQFSRGNFIDPATCQQTGIVSQPCVLDCPQDCVLTSWSPWSNCTTVHGPGYRTRRRKITKHENSFGRPCPEELFDNWQVEADVFTEGCDQYRWVTDHWNDCMPKPNENVDSKMCGTNFQTRRVRCVLIKDGQHIPAESEFLCNNLEKPDKKRSCHMPCPFDCAVSEWSEWSNCSHPCDATKYRKRTREIIRVANSSNDQPCPRLSENELCILGDFCFDYEWILGDWGSCRVRSGAQCGLGTQKRALMCQRSDGRPVPTEFCQHLLPLPGSTLEMNSTKLERNCTVDCPVDCLVSPWRDWDISSCKPCAMSSLSSRTRSVLQFPTQTGRPCPSLLQTKPCAHLACYHWDIEEWTKCQLEVKSSCGFGSQSRNVKCLRSDGVEVDKHLCALVNSSDAVISAGWLDIDWLMEAQDVKHTRECHIPCPGDCLLSDWSVWGHCHRDCNHGQTIGYQTRSRVILSQPSSTSDGDPCEEKLYETRPCWSGECLTFNWKVVGDKVKCMRSDGLFVEGGCSGKRHPCLLACETWGGECDYSTGTCRCPAGTRWHSTPATAAVSDADATHSDTDAQFPRGSPPHSDTLSAGRCNARTMDLRGTLHNHSLSGTTIKFLPDDNEASFWMYAMISVGTAFVIFVAVTVYLMCHSSLRERLQDVRRQGSLRRRPPMASQSNLATVDLNGGPKMT